MFKTGTTSAQGFLRFARLLYAHACVPTELRAFDYEYPSVLRELVAQIAAQS